MNSEEYSEIPIIRELRIDESDEFVTLMELAFKDTIEQAASQKPKRLVLFMDDLDFMASAGLRMLIFAKQKMGTDVSIHVIGSKGPVRNTLEMSGFHLSVYMQDSFTG